MFLDFYFQIEIIFLFQNTHLIKFLSTFISLLPSLASPHAAPSCLPSLLREGGQIFIPSLPRHPSPRRANEGEGGMRAFREGGIPNTRGGVASPLHSGR